MEANAYISYEFKEYYNRNEKNWDNGKCDALSACNYYFIMCSDRGDINHPCNYGYLTTKIWNATDTLKFTKGEALTSGGILNPYTISTNEPFGVRYI